MTVISLKDIIRYLIKIVIVIVILLLFSKLFLNSSEGRDKSINFINQNQLISCLDETIPAIKEVNGKQDDIEEIKSIEPLKVLLGMQLSVIDNLQAKEVISELVENEEEETLELQQAGTGLETQVVENNVPTKYTNIYNGVQVKNETSYDLTEEMLTPNITINNENILIFHTHTCESYTASADFSYEQSGTYRTTDLNYTVSRVGDELANYLKSYNYNVIHDKTYHDYPAYSGSYGRSLTTVKNILASNQDTDVVIDIHRDAIGDYSYAPTVKIGDEYAAQLMFVIGTDGGGLEHDNWNENLKFAVKIQEKANELYPGLFKPIILRNSRYNQHLSKASTIIEVGATGNTMEQCLTSMKYLSKIMSEVVK